MDDDARDALLTRLDERTKNIQDTQVDLKKGMYGEDGNGGFCKRISDLDTRVSKMENFQSTLIGIAVTLSLAISTGGYWVLNHIRGS